MKKTLKTLTTFLLLFALLAGIKPIQPPVDTDTEPGISVCTDDNADNSDIDVIRNE